MSRPTRDEQSADIIGGGVIMFPKPLLITLLFLSFAPLMSIHAFKVIFSSSRTHQNITQAAILQKTVEACQSYAQQHGRIFVKPNSLTVESVGAACTSPSSASTLKSAISEVSKRNAWVDGKHILDAEYHFDDESFVKGRRLITDGLSLVKAALGQKNYQLARQRLGETLHTLQDFYSHSNWIELGKRSPYSNLIKPDLPLENIADLNTPTCRSCEDGICSDNILESVIAEQKLTSGYFSLTSSSKPNGKCSHGGLGDLTSLKDPKGGINKDAADTPHGNLHDDAANVAEAATAELLQDIREAAGDQEFLRLMGVSPSSAVLCFVIDTSVSMVDDIAEVKRVTSFIINSRLGTADEPSLYILVTFNDPDFGPLRKTTSPDKFKQYIQDISASGGGDDPEMSLSGLWLALAGAPAESEIFLFTDAEAKDTEKKSTVLALIESTKSTVNFMLTNPLSNTSRSVSNPVNQLYEDLALASGGQAIEVRKELLANATSVITDLSISALVTIFQVERNPGKAESFSYVVDSSVKNLTIYITGNVTKFYIVGPSGLSQMSDQTNSSLGLIQTVGNFYTITIKQNSIQAGQWIINITSSQPYTIRVTGKSATDFQFDFVDITQNPDPVYTVFKSRPHANKNVTLLLSMLGTGAERPTDVTLVATSDSTVYPGILQDAGNGDYLVTVSRVPRGDFFIRVMGHTNSTANETFQRQSSTRYRVSNITVSADRNGVWAPGRTISVLFNMKSTSTSENYSITARNNQLYSMSFPSSLPARGDSVASGMVNITAPVNTTAGTEVILTIEVALQGQNDSNYAILQLAVSGAVAPPAALELSLWLSGVALFFSLFSTK